MPPSDDTLSFRKEALSTPYSSKIFTPISLKNTYPIKYPKHAPRTDANVATAAILTQSFLFDLEILLLHLEELFRQACHQLISFLYKFQFFYQNNL